MRVRSKVFVTVSAEEQARLYADESFLLNVDQNKVTAALDMGRAGDDLNVADDLSCSAVHKATRHQDLTLLKYLIAGNALVDFPDNDGAGAIVYAIRYDNAAAVELLLGLKKDDGTRRVNILQSQKTTGNTLLHEAAWHDRTDCAQLLFATGAFTQDNLGKVNLKGHTALHIAGFRAGTSFIQLLIEHGANIETKTSNPRQLKKSAIDLAVETGKEANAQCLQELSVAVNSIRFASRMKGRVNANKLGEAVVTTTAPATTTEPSVAAAIATTVVPAVSALPAALAAPIEKLSVLHIRFEYDLKLFTANLENAFITHLAKHAGMVPEEVYVLSRTAGSVILQIGLRGPAGPAALAKINASSLDELSSVLGYPVLERSVAKPFMASTPRLTPRGTPGYKPLAAVASSPLAVRPGPE